MKRLLVTLAVPLLFGVVVIDLARTLPYLFENRYWTDGFRYLAAAALVQELNQGVTFAAVAGAILLGVALAAGRRGRSAGFLLAIWAAEAVLLVHRARHGRD